MCIRVAIVRGAAPLSHSFSALVSGQASHRRPFCAVEAASTGTGPAFAFRVSALILANCCITTPLRQVSQRPKVGKRERNLQTNSIATRKRTWVVPRYPRAHYSIWPVNREGYAVHERRENACLTRAILRCYKVLSTSYRSVCTVSLTPQLACESREYTF